MKAHSSFEVISPDTPDSSGPVMAIAHELCLRGDDGTKPIVELPHEIDGVRLYAGVILSGTGQIFKEHAEEINPRELKVISTPDHPQGETSARRISSWD